MAESKAASPSSPVPQTGEALEQLQTDEQRRFLDTIDELRSLGLDKHKIDLPQLVVVGDQSSGKSSVLDAITRVRFPSNPGTCTTFATELIMRKTSAWRCSIFIQPGECDETTSAALKQFHATCSSPEEVPHWIDKAKECINHHSKFRAAEFSDHILRVSIAGPDIPPLTLVDLPGLIHSSDRPRDKEIVRSLVNKYVSNSRAIILTVITAQYERHLQEALEIAEKGDPSCQRTFGVITKPDQANDQICRDTYVSFAKGTDTRYKQEWHVLKNRGDGEAQKALSSAARDQQEQEFFSSKEGWVTVPKDRVGAAALRQRLSEKLYRKVLDASQGVKDDMWEMLHEARTELGRLRKPRATVAEQRSLLHHLSQEFYLITNMAIKGNYGGHEFFYIQEDSNVFNGSDGKRLRANLRKENELFCEAMHKYGNRWHIETDGSDPPAEPPSRNVSKPQVIAIEKYVEKIKTLLSQNRGSEPTGSYNPYVIQDLFREQCGPWKRLAEMHLAVVIEVVEDFFDNIALFLADGDDKLFEALGNHLRADLKAREPAIHQVLDQLFVPLFRGPMITCDPEYILDIGRAKQNRWAESMSRKFQLNSVPIQGLGNVQDLASMSWFQRSDDPETVVHYEILDTMTAFYNRSLRQFIDNVTNLAVEGGLLEGLPGTFSSIAVDEMSPEKVYEIAAEAGEIIAHREKLQKKVADLEAGLELFKSHRRRRMPVTTPQKTKAAQRNHPFQNTTDAASSPYTSTSMPTPESSRSKSSQDSASSASTVSASTPNTDVMDGNTRLENPFLSPTPSGNRKVVHIKVPSEDQTS